jgi:hypothetical protein
LKSNLYNMRICLTLAGLFIFLHACPQSADDKRSAKIILQNRVSNQVSWDYAYKGQKAGKTGVKTSLTVYDATGNIAQVTTYNPKGAIVNIEKYKYDSHGNKTEYSRYPGSISAQAAYQKISKYNDMNLVTEESGYDGVEHFTNNYKYDNEGELIEIRYMKNSILGEKRVFNKNGSSTTVSIYNSAGVLSSKLLLKYDEHKNLVEEAVYGVNQSELEKKTYNYDNNKNLKEEAKYKLDKITLKTCYNYNANGDLVEISEEVPETVKFIKKSYTYDTGGNLLEINWRRKGNEEFNRITYTYDNKGLCISADTWYPATKYRVLTRYTYEVNK